MTDGKITKGENSASISLKLELLNIVKRHAGQDKQINGFWICKRWLMFDEEIKKEIIAEHGQAFYDELLLHYSKTNIQQRAEREVEEQAKEIRKNAREEANNKIEELKRTPEKRRRLSEDEKILSILENYNLTPEQKADPVFMEPRNKRIAELKQKIAQSEPKP